MSCPAGTTNTSNNVTGFELLNSQAESGERSEEASLGSEVWPWIVKFVQWLICVVGMAGNWSVVVVYKSKRLNRTPSENFILLMALFDLSMTLLTLFFTASQQYLLPLNCFFFCATGNFSFDFINTSSSILMMFITLNRYVAVCYPHSYKTLFSQVRTRACVSVCVIAGLLNTPVGVLMCRKFITPSDLECGCHEVIHPAPKVAVLKLVWVLIRAVMMIVNSANMTYCYSKIYHKMVAKIKSRDCNKASLKNLKKVMEEEEQDFTTPAVRKVGVTRQVGGAKSEKVCKIDDVDDSNEVVLLTNERVSKMKGPAEATVVSDGKALSPLAATTATPVKDIGNGSSSFSQGVCVKGSLTIKASGSSRTKDQKLTTTLFVVSIAYVILVTPDLIIHVMDVFAFLQDNKFQNFRTVTQTLYLINFVINPFIHLLVNSYYKEEVKRRFKCCL